MGVYVVHLRKDLLDPVGLSDPFEVEAASTVESTVLEGTPALQRTRRGSVSVQSGEMHNVHGYA